MRRSIGAARAGGADCSPQYAARRYWEIDRKPDKYCRFGARFGRLAPFVERYAISFRCAQRRGSIEVTRIRVVFWTLLLALPALWLAAETSPRAQPYLQGQYAYANLTGILAMGVMAVALLLALRSTAVEPRLGGLLVERRV